MRVRPCCRRLRQPSSRSLLIPTRTIIRCSFRWRTTMRKDCTGSQHTPIRNQLTMCRMRRWRLTPGLTIRIIRGLPEAYRISTGGIAL
jgi:hypothetical protein